MKKQRFAILGAGAGGQTMAAVLASNNHSVKVYDTDQNKIDRLKNLGKISVSGEFECIGSPDLFTNDIDEAMRDISVVMVTTTADAHKDVATKIAPYLKDGTIILLNPGQVGGALEVSHIIREVHCCDKEIIIGETSDLMYACRTSKVGFTYQSGIKLKTNVATLPGKDINKLMSALSDIFPSLYPVKNVLETGFDGGNAMLHPIPSLMNVNKMDDGTSYDYYIEGITPSIARLITAADGERLKVCALLGLHIPSTLKSLQESYGLEQNDLYDLLQHNPAYVGVKCPMSFSHRFIVEDIVSGLVPLASVGNLFGISTPIMNAFIDIGSIICQRDFRKEGRTAEALGLSGKSVEEIFEMVN